MPHDYVEIEFEAVRRETELAYLIVVDGQEIWIPKSQIHPEDRDQYEEGDGDGSICVSEWIAREKNLL